MHQLLHDAADPREHLEGRRQRRRRDAAIAARSSCSISFIHSSLVWCCTMKSISSWSRRERMLRVQHLVEMQVVA
jgi:hypothetical protein